MEKLDVALFNAVVAGKTDDVNTLLGYGANTKAVNAEYQTPLHLAVLHGRLDIAQSLVIHGADVNAINGDPQSQLLLTATAETRMSALSTNGINAQCQTPLHLAVLLGFHDIAKMLVKHGANSDIADMKDQSAWNLAKYKKDVKMCRILKPNPSTFYIALRGIGTVLWLFCFAVLILGVALEKANQDKLGRTETSFSLFDNKFLTVMMGVLTLGWVFVGFHSAGLWIEIQ